MRKHFVAITFAIVVSACVPPDPKATSVISDPHTGRTSVASPSLGVSLPGRDDGSMTAQVAWHPEVGYVVFTDVTRQGWMFPREAWSMGRKLNYKHLESNVNTCYGGNCTVTESGAIVMSRADFVRAAEAGLSFKLIGTRGSIEGLVPAEAFAGVIKKLPEN